LDRRDFLLAQRREGDDAEVDLVAARLLVFGDHIFEGGILLLGEALGESRLRGLCLRIGDKGPRQGPGRAKGEGAAKHRTPRQNGHFRLLALLATVKPSRANLA
jgi:hypothetical protein